MLKNKGFSISPALPNPPNPVCELLHEVSSWRTTTLKAMRTRTGNVANVIISLKSWKCTITCRSVAVADACEFRRETTFHSQRRFDLQCCLFLLLLYLFLLHWAPARLHSQFCSAHTVTTKAVFFSSTGEAHMTDGKYRQYKYLRGNGATACFFACTLKIHQKKKKK